MHAEEAGFENSPGGFVSQALKGRTSFLFFWWKNSKKAAWRNERRLRRQCRSEAALSARV